MVILDVAISKRIGQGARGRRVADAVIHLLEVGLWQPLHRREARPADAVYVAVRAPAVWPFQPLSR